MQSAKSNKINILHITPHLGGGVGSVLLNFLSYVKNDGKYCHSIVTLDYANEKSKKISNEVGFELFSDMHKNVTKLLDLIKNVDIILIHFWNHPLLYDFLIRNELPESRVILWSHISGFTPPNIFTQKALSYPDKFVFTTPLSFNTKEVKEFEDKAKFEAVWSTGGIEHVKNIKPKPHKGFNIGYIGTLDYSKLHPDFLNICSKIDIPDVRFIVCGDEKHLDLKRQAQELGISDKFEFTGQVQDVSTYLKIFDVFGYPLNPQHYGTCDQVLQEALSAGVVPVALNNPMENYMLKNGEIGIIANSKDEYIFSIEKLYYNENLRQELSKKAKEYAISQYSLEKLKNDWYKIFDEILKSEKTSKKWEIKSDDLTHFDIFMESLGTYKGLFMIQSDKDVYRLSELGKLPNWQSRTKGTVHQYYEFFKSSEELKKISEIMRKEEIKIA